MKKPFVVAALLAVLGVCAFFLLRTRPDPEGPMSHAPSGDSPATAESAPPGLLPAGPARAPDRAATTILRVATAGARDGEAPPSESRVGVSVFRSTGAPADGAAVTLKDLVSETLITSGTADRTGQVALASNGLHPGLVLRASLGDEVAIHSTADDSIAADAGRSVVMQLEPATSIRVRVLDPTGGPIVASASIRNRSVGTIDFRSRAEDAWVLESSPLPPSALTRSLRMDVRAPHFAPATAPVPTSAADARAIEVRLVPVVRVRGRLLSADGTALTGTAQIVGPERHAYHSVRSTHPNGDSHEVSSGDEDLLVNTGRDGRFDVEGLRSDGGDLVLFADGFAPLRRRALRGDQGDVDLGDLTLDAGADVRGVVVDAASRPISGAWVEIEGGDADSVIACGETDAHGAFVLPHIGLGGHTVVASWSDGGADSQRREGKAVGVRAGASAVRVVLVGGLTVRFFFAGTSTPLPTSSATISVAAIDERGDSTSSSVHSNGHAMNRIRLESGAGRFDVAIEIPGYDKVEFKDVPVLTVEETILDAQFRVSSK